MELVREHLVKIQQDYINALIDQHLTFDEEVASIPLFEASQVYAMSCLFGYWLHNVDKRFQLEKLAGQRFALEKLIGNSGAQGKESEPGTKGSFFGEYVGSIRSESLKDYISTFRPEDFQRMSSLTSTEATTAIELQVTALFGDIGALKEKFENALGRVTSAEEDRRKMVEGNEVESIRITSQDLTRLVLEAIAYGSLLNEAEKQVNTIYELTPS
jgi:hypothetical protein